MKRYQDRHVVVTLSDEGLRRAYGDNELLNRLKRVEKLHKIVAVVSSWGFAFGLGFVIAWSAVNGN